MKLASTTFAAADSDCRACRIGKPDPFMWVDGTAYLRCPRCEATLMAAAHLPDWQAEAAQYRLHRNDVNDPGYRRFLSRLVDPLAECLPSGAQGLDYGCGPGPVGAAMLRERGFDVVEFDPVFAPDKAVLGRKYDFILCSEVFEHFHHPADEMDRRDELLVTGGWLGVMTGFEHPEQDFATWQYRRDPTHVVFYRRTTLERLAEERGWAALFPATNIALLRKSVVTSVRHTSSPPSIA